MIPLPSDPSESSESFGRTHRSPGATLHSDIREGPQSVVIPAGLDVLVVGISALGGPGVLSVIAEHSRLEGVPVVVLLDSADQLTPEQYVRYGVTDFVLPTVGVDELVLRLHVISARRRDFEATEAAAQTLRSKVRDVSAALAASPETYDTATLSRIFIQGLTVAFDADGVYLELFDDERAGLLREQWPACSPAGTPAPAVTGPDAVRLARSLWDGSRIGIFNPAHCGEDAQLPAGTASLVGKDAAPCFTVAVPLGEAERVSGLLQIIGDTGSLPWTDLHSSLVQHVAGNFLQALRQHKVHARNVEAIERLTYLNFLKDDFVATINHEFRTPLATITGHLEMVADGFLGPIPENQKETLDILLRNTDRLNNLVANILTVSTLNQSRTEPNLVNINDVLTTVVTSFKAAAAAKSITLTSDVPEEPVTVAGHAGELEEALRNVLRNSVDYTSPHGAITLTLDSSLISGTHALHRSAPDTTTPDSTTGRETTGNETLGNEAPATGPGGAFPAGAA
ncbi:MAG: hypothetical protein JWM61_2773, partial [Micrococcaceae bacterium]|nr:hypothetical protein [Micrococcaceae bacterium]